MRHRLAKKHPLDCGKANCYLCHGDKLLNIKNPHDIKRSKVKLEEDYYLLKSWEYELWHGIG